MGDSNWWVDVFGLSNKNTILFTDLGGLTLEVKNIQDISHLSTSQLEYMAKNGVAGLTKADGIKQVIILHHQKQQNSGPIIEMPSKAHKNGNKKQHPYFPDPHPTEKVDRERFDKWKVEYWKFRANEELEKQKQNDNSCTQKK